MKVIFYRTSKGKEPFEIWLRSLKDQQVITRIRDRIDRITEFNFFGDYKRVDEEIYELRFHFGAGYRVYFAYQEEGEQIVAILCGGNKSSQNADIPKAKQYLEDFKNV